MKIKYLILLLCLNNSALVYAGNGTESEEAEELDFSSLCVPPVQVWADLPAPASNLVYGDADDYLAHASDEPAPDSYSVSAEPATNSFSSGGSVSSSCRPTSTNEKRRRPKDELTAAEKETKRKKNNRESAAKSRERQRACLEKMQQQIAQLQAELAQANAHVARLKAAQQRKKDPDPDSGCSSCRERASY